MSVMAEGSFLHRRIHTHRPGSAPRLSHENRSQSSAERTSAEYSTSQLKRRPRALAGEGHSRPLRGRLHNATSTGETADSKAYSTASVGRLGAARMSLSALSPREVPQAFHALD